MPSSNEEEKVPNVKQEQKTNLASEETKPDNQPCEVPKVEDKPVVSQEGESNQEKEEQKEEKQTTKKVKK